MFKKGLLLFLAIVSMFIPTSCVKHNNHMLIIDISEGGTILKNALSEANLANEFKTLHSQSTYSTIINDTEVTGLYEKTLVSPYYECDADIYTAKLPDGADVNFKVNKETKKIVAYSIAYRGNYAIQKDSLSYEDCLKIAQAALSSFDKIGTYKSMPSEVNNPLLIPECGNTYSFYFIKTIQEKETNIIVHIGVNTDGLIVSFNAPEVPSLNSEDIEWLESYKPDAKVVESDINAKIQSLMDPSVTGDVSIVIQKESYAKLKDGHFYVIYDVMVKSDMIEESDYIRLLKRL